MKLAKPITIRPTPPLPPKGKAKNKRQKIRRNFRQFINMAERNSGRYKADLLK